MIWKILFVSCMAKFVSSVMFDDPDSLYGLPVKNGVTQVKYRVPGGFRDVATMRAVEEVMEELRRNVHSSCLNIEYTDEKLMIEPNYPFYNMTLRLIYSKLPKRKQDKLKNLSDLNHGLWPWKWESTTWFNYYKNINPNKTLTINIWNVPSTRETGAYGLVNTELNTLTMKQYLPSNSDDAVVKQWKGTFLHEMFHVFGINHTHRRSDSYQHIIIIEKNIDPNEKYNYEMRENSKNSGPYECNSIMHYKNGVFRKDPKNLEQITMIARNNSTCPEFGNLKATTNDWRSLRRRLGCQQWWKP